MLWGISITSRVTYGNRLYPGIKTKCCSGSDVTICNKTWSVIGCSGGWVAYDVYSTGDVLISCHILILNRFWISVLPLNAWINERLPHCWPTSHNGTLLFMLKLQWLAEHIVAYVRANEAWARRFYGFPGYLIMVGILKSYTKSWTNQQTN